MLEVFMSLMHVRNNELELNLLDVWIAFSPAYSRPKNRQAVNMLNKYAVGIESPAHPHADRAQSFGSFELFEL